MDKTEFESLVKTDRALNHLIRTSTAFDPPTTLLQARKEILQAEETPGFDLQLRVWQDPKFLLTVWEQDVIDHGKKYTYHFAGFDRTEPGVVIVPIDDKGRVLLGWHYRVANRQWSLELPRGASMDGETVLDTARRELMEETGLTASRLKEVAAIHADGGIVHDDVRVVRADVGSAELAPQDFELRYLDWYSPDEVRRLVKDNTVTCSLTMSALMIVL